MYSDTGQFVHKQKYLIQFIDQNLAKSITSFLRVIDALSLLDIAKSGTEIDVSYLRLTSLGMWQ